MFKIVEFFADVITPRVMLYTKSFEGSYNTGGVLVNSFVEQTPKLVAINSQQCKSYQIYDKMFDAKLKYINENGTLIITTNDKNLFGFSFIQEKENLYIYKIAYQKNIIYNDEYFTKTITSYDENIIKKIDLVYDLISQSAYKLVRGAEAIKLTVDAIKMNYMNTGIIVKEDLDWLNIIYTKFK